MASYQESMSISASADQVFDFIADIRNLPKYIPTTKSAQPDDEGGERVQLQGEAKGHKYNADGYLRADRQNYRLEWGADERYYSGHMEVQSKGNNQSQVTVEITFKDNPPGADEGDKPSDADIREGLRKALESIQNQVTGQGGKEEPGAAT
jgi:uncharacterized membrane protein